MGISFRSFQDAPRHSFTSKKLGKALDIPNNWTKMKAVYVLTIITSAVSPALALKATTTRYYDGLKGACGCGSASGNSAFSWQVSIQDTSARPAPSSFLPQRHHIYGPPHNQLTSPPERHCRRHLHSRGLASPLRQIRALLVRRRLREVLQADLHRERALLLVRDGRRGRQVHHRDGDEPVPEQRQRPVVSDRRRYEPVRLLVPLRHHGPEPGAR